MKSFSFFISFLISWIYFNKSSIDRWSIFFFFKKETYFISLFRCCHSYMTSRVSMKMTRIAYRNFKVFTSKKTFWISHSPTTCHYNPPLCISHDVNFRTFYPSRKISRVFKRGINFQNSFFPFFCLFFFFFTRFLQVSTTTNGEESTCKRRRVSRFRERKEIFHPRVWLV